jgi:biotin transporter BioY
VVISALIKVKSIDNDKVGFAFLAGVTVKLIFGTLYFYFFLPKNKFIVLQFILFYLIYLFIETFMAFKIISSQPTENQEEK